MNKHKIMIVEDDQFLRKIYQTKLEKEGHEVMVASNGEEALTVLETGIPEIILLDLVMPQLDGFGFLEKKQQLAKAKDVPVIVLSNLGQQSDIDRTNFPDVAGYAIKSNTSLAEILQKIEEVLKK
jgi:OmpR family response regulator RpaB